MPDRLLLTGEVNVMNVADARAPFRRIAEKLRSADVVFSNLECCPASPPRRVRMRLGSMSGIFLELPRVNFCGLFIGGAQQGHSLKWGLA